MMRTSSHFAALFGCPRRLGAWVGVGTQGRCASVALGLALSLLFPSLGFPASSDQTSDQLTIQSHDPPGKGIIGAPRFEQQIAPLLARRCLVCHEGEDPKGGLDLTRRDGLLQGGESGPALRPGAPNESLLWERIAHGEMPPGDEPKLTDQEQAQLSSWIEEGAPWPLTAPLSRFQYPPDWWSLQPVQRPPIPASTPPAATPIDAFLEETLQQQQLTPSNLASRQTLYRRLSYDLLGLPPVPAEMTAFVADRSDDAYTRCVDRMLASPQYGERWGRHWLDVVRYADTAGETADYPVPEAYRYRNYVIDAWNDDKPYDQFLQEQLAGDILAQQAAQTGRVTHARYAELITATGYLAISRRFGFDTERYEHLTIQDTIDNVGQVVQGLTLGCARCHDHKFDPIGVRDYYGLYGIFASTRYAFAGSERLPATRAMTPLVPPQEAGQKWQQWSGQILALRDAIRQRKPDYQLPANPAQARPLTDLDGDFELQASPSGGSLGLPANPWRPTGEVRIETSAQSPFAHVYPTGNQGAKIVPGQKEFGLVRGLSASTQATQTSQASATPPSMPLYFAFDFRVTSADPTEVGSCRVWLGRRASEKMVPQLELFLGRDAMRVSQDDTWLPIASLQTNAWYHVRVQLDMETGKYDGAIYTMSPKQKDIAQKDTAQKETAHNDPAHKDLAHEEPVQEFSGQCLTGARSASSDMRSVTQLGVDSSGDAAGPKPGYEFDNFYLSRDASPLPHNMAAHPSTVGRTVAVSVKGAATPTVPLPQPAEGTADVETLQQQVIALLNTPPYPQAYAVWEGAPHDATIQRRGDPERPGDQVPRQFLQVLGGDRPLTAATQSGRHDLALWLTRRENRLTARVMVNRLWQHHFGHGLVRTENDFGTRGQKPTHPALLDWLASELIDSGWSLKSVQRQIVLSDAYQRSSQAAPGVVAADPENRYLARFPRRRLDAESIRDALLAVSGDLDYSMGGPHPFPAPLQTRYSQHHPFRDEYPSFRRSVYLMTQRLKRHSFLALFDGSDTNASTAKRTPSTIPPQALYMMNDPFVHERSQHFAQRLLAQPIGDAERIARAIEWSLGRTATASELTEAEQFMQRYAERLQTVRPGGAAATGQQDVWAAYCRTLFARNEFIYVD